MSREALLARTLVELSDTLVDDFDLVELLITLTNRCVEVLDVAAAGIMLASADGRLRMVASSSPALRLLELFEEQFEEGPCPDSYRTGKPVINLDLADVGDLWPRFGPRAIAAGFRSAHALPMRLRARTIGALNLLRVDDGQLNSADVAVAQVFADAATIGILQHRAAIEADVLNAQLQGALNSRIVIEQAKGVVAESLGDDMEQAFRRLHQYARNNNKRLTDVARSVVDKTLAPRLLNRS
jgi:GAF domain-containing protein